MTAPVRWLADRLQFLTRGDVIVDLHVYGGLLLAGVGGWHISRPWTCVVGGLVLAALGFVNAAPRRTG